MTSIRLTESFVDSLFTEEDADDGRAILSQLPVRVLRSETGRAFSAALVSVGSLSIEVEMDDTGRINTWCTHDSRDGCPHAAAALYALAESEPPFGVGGVGSSVRSRPEGEPWERALRGLIAPAPDLDDADPPGAIALLFDVRPAAGGEPAGAGVAIRPAVRGSRGSAGRWVRSGISWREVSESSGPDPSRRALADIAGLFEGRHNFPAAAERMRRGRGGHEQSWGLPDWIRLDATPSPGLWDALLAAHDAGVEFVVDSTAQSVVGVEQAPREAVIDLRMMGDRLWIEAGLGDLDAGFALLPIGAPTTALAMISGGAVDAILPLARPATPAWDTLFRQGHLSIPPTRIADFANDYLPALRDIAPLVSSDGSFAVPEAPRPDIVLALANAGPVARLYWEWEYPPGARRDRAAERELIADVERAAGRWAGLLRRRRADPLFPAIDLDRDQTVEFLAHVLPALRGVEGLRIEAHDEVPALEFASEAPRISFGVSPSGEDWFDLDIVVTIQGEPVSSSELIRALSRGQTYFRLLSGTVFPLTDEHFARLRDVLTEAKALRDDPPEKPSIPRYQFDLWYELAEIGVLDAQHTAWLDSMRALGDDAVAPVDPPPSFRATLRDYQRDGYSWLDFLRRHRLGGILADDMGLGKTVQMLAALDRARIDEPDARFLVVTPTSVIGHWLSEAERFAPEMRTAGLMETSAKRGTGVAEAAADASLIVTSYAILRLDAEQFHELGVRVLVLDEAQNVKNSSSKGYAAAALVGAPTVFAVSGTPLENNLMELYALASLTAPGLLGTRETFREQFSKAISKDGNAHRLAQLRKRIRPFLLRRTKEQVAPELPPKTVQVLEVPLHPTHLRAYERRFRREQQKLLGLLDDVKKNQIQILASLTRLRREALDPAFGDAAGLPGVSSAKLTALAELLDEITADGHRALVFSQFTDFLGRAAEVAEKKGLKFSYLDGSTTARARSRMVERFTSGEDPAFFISLKAGGTGLNLTAADYVILLDPWWNPAAEEQAIDRAHRIGQDKPVVVYRLISAGTIEQKVRELQEKKRRLFDDVLGGDVTSSLTTDDYRALLA
jgi:superfamily II DNA or RNA helicase